MNKYSIISKHIYFFDCFRVIKFLIKTFVFMFQVEEYQTLISDTEKINQVKKSFVIYRESYQVTKMTVIDISQIEIFDIKVKQTI